LTQTEPLCPSLSTETALRRCEAIRAHLSAAGLWADPSSTAPAIQTSSWRISPCPLLLSPEQLGFFVELGPHLFSFYRTLNRLYSESVKGAQPRWVADYLDQGKPEALVTYSRMKRFRDTLPAVIRPDVIPTADGMIITELDSVPGGIGLTAALGRAYADVIRESSIATDTSLRHLPGSSAFHDLTGSLPSARASDVPPFAPDGYEIVGGADGMVRGFASMLRSAQTGQRGCIAIMVSDESRDYRPEMTWMAAQLRERGVSAWCIEPREIRFTEEGLRLPVDGREEAVGLIYRFFELFDLPNIPKADLVQYAAKKGWVAVTPPYKPALEEKSAFALLHHPVLRPYWRRELGQDTYVHLTTIMPRTWLLDPSPIPPAATIPDLHIGERAVANWADLATATQKERHFVIKPSGFSELAWGSRGVSVGHDLPQTAWAGALQHALVSFHRTPYILQEFHKGRLCEIDYLDEGSQTVVRMEGRARLSPYYFVTGEKVELAGILATICPADKKVLHGMKDAVMAPCAVAKNNAA
jgi:hypothetical protein